MSSTHQSHVKSSKQNLNNCPSSLKINMASVLTLRDLMEEEKSTPSDAVIFVGISLVLGIACRHLLKGTRVPYTVALLVIGIGLGSLEYGTHHHFWKIGDSIRI
ncbi:hypothetical protein Leryth_009271, partial [Lithospermum erythrorhizon]